MTTNSDPALWEMFRSEVDAHMAVLCDGLLALEKDPSHSGQFDALMRAAHSIKGAAKVVGVPAAVQVAHALEDCFVAAREGRLAMSSSLVDVLFAAVDLLGRVAQDDAPDAVAALLPQVSAVTQSVERATRGGTIDKELPNSAAANLPVHSARSLPTQLFRPKSAFNAAWVTEHHREIAAKAQQAPRELHFEFSLVESIDPIGLALLATLSRPAANDTSPRAVQIQLSGVSPALRELLRATGLDCGCRITAAEG